MSMCIIFQESQDVPSSKQQTTSKLEIKLWPRNFVYQIVLILHKTDTADDAVASLLNVKACEKPGEID